MISTKTTEMTSNPMSNMESGGTEPEPESESDRHTMVLARCDDDEDGRFVRSIPDILLMTKETTSEIFFLAVCVSFLQIITSTMVTVSTLRSKYVGQDSFENIVTYVTSSVAIAASTNQSFTELWANNACIELIKKEDQQKKEDKKSKKYTTENLTEEQKALEAGEAMTIKLKDQLITLYYVGQVVLMIATVVSVGQQPTPEDIITNCTGLLLIQNLDQVIFACWKVEAKGSHKFKVKLHQVKQDPRFTSKMTFLSGSILLFAATVFLSVYYS